MVRKQVDTRVTQLIQRCIERHERLLLVMVGDRCRDQVVNLHTARTRMKIGKPSVLWCYKKDLGFTTHREKRLRQIRRRQKSGNYDTEREDPFWLFQQGTDVRYCRYRDCSKILGHTYDFCVLQDFESLTPNVLCQTVETCAGGGLVILMMKRLDNLKMLHETVSMDYHKRLFGSQDAHNDTHSDVFKLKARFAERLILSMTKCANALFVDDELNVLPLTETPNGGVNALPHTRADTLSPTGADTHTTLTTLKQKYKQDTLLSPIINLCRTLDQLKCVTAINKELNNRSIVAVTSARGRGKSAALGLAVSLALCVGVKCVCVTAPSPENVQTVFEFVSKGVSAAMGLSEDDGSIFREQTVCVDAEEQRRRVDVCVRVRRDGKSTQVVRFVQPDSKELGHCDLLVIDEAAALHTHTLDTLLKSPQPILMATTIGGYEGSDNALVMRVFNKSNERLKVLRMSEPIRYALGDPVEAWLNRLLCLELNTHTTHTSHTPHTPPLSLYKVNRDLLFSFHEMAERVLNEIWSVLMAKTSRLSPDSLLYLADSPTHEILVVSHTHPHTSHIPILAVLEVCYEGGKIIAEEDPEAGAKRLSAQDDVAYLVAEAFSTPEILNLNHLRVVRFGLHPSVCVDVGVCESVTQKALDLLIEYALKEPTPVVDTPIDTPLLTDDITPAVQLDILTHKTQCVTQPFITHDFVPLVHTGTDSFVIGRQLRDRSGVDPDWLGRFTYNFGLRLLRVLPRDISLEVDDIRRLIGCSLKRKEIEVGEVK
eukprot:Blabericola_migrator_1__2228@NODE_1614_length_4166_cov_98_861430_g1051_i0_p1_GENE_NODE_1614_length_4166_cov_98_861430_g1051_i0NODE_1614_length_4166_cov_98_861430_g1051_i0_p1_ORF_typecomplete_len768_score197_22Helicase_RecD/PF05127_14/1_4e44DUF1726/PF08351_11/1e23DUF1726/PF08351_11/4_7e03DUF1726/PF08351_11/9e03GNAT_acetyltr_2/PF13718_6/1_3e08AAA_30/PF13604_6/0_00018AAA_22/PF13401_6/0_47PIF1/PF05970_14/2_2e03PIF1/PF05970_14/0_58_NODE_1614_length_4166_cov_98_861430_g1051_i0202323